MDTTPPKISRRLILFFGMFIFSAAAVYAQTCQPVNGSCPVITGATCAFPANVEKGCNCYDGIDNDNDGKADALDPDCLAYLAPYVGGSGSTCLLPPPASSDSLALVGIKNVVPSSQNTSDTPAHNAIADVDGDGIPEGITTSKWNANVRVVDLLTGNVKGSVQTNQTPWPAYNGFSTNGTFYTYEHETAVADIDGDKVAEIYTIASYRGNGGPKNSPIWFYLCGYEYHPNPNFGGIGLQQLFDPIPLSADRPGSPGLADFNGDGLAEIYIRNQIYDAKTGKLLADGGGDWHTAINTGSVAVDMDGDGLLELVCGNFIYKVPPLTSRTLQTLTVWKDMNADFPTKKFYPKGYNDLNEYGPSQASSTSTADFDTDGFIDVFITGAVNCSGNEASPCGSNATTIFYWNVHKNTLQTYTPTDPSYPLGWAWGTGRINLYDAFPNHGGLEALFCAGNKIFCLDSATFANGTSSGNALWVRTTNDALSGILALTCFDFDNNGTVEVVYRDTYALVVTDGQTGTKTLSSSVCQSHTMTEGPVIAGVPTPTGIQTAICIPCYTNPNAFKISNSTTTQQSLGYFGAFYTSSVQWLPTRRIWNQHPYYVSNINDNVTIPKTQLSQDLIFGNGTNTCPNGVRGPQRPLNLFMDQVPFLDANGCPQPVAPNITFYGDSPNPSCVGVSPLPAGCDTNGDGVYTPAVVVTPPICGNLGITVKFNITNNGNLSITDNIPVSFFNGDPTANPVVATRLYNTTMSVSNLQVGATFSSQNYTFNGPGTTFDLYIVMYNNGAVLPVTFTSAGQTQCNINDKMYKVTISPTPFTVTTELLQDNQNCPPFAAATNNGHVRSHIYLSGTPLPSPLPPEPAYGGYTFQWYDATQTTVLGSTYDLGNLDQGTYYVKVKDNSKGCTSPFVPVTVARTQPPFPNFTVTKISDQTTCSPLNGHLTVAPDDASTGYIYTWLSYPGLVQKATGADANGLASGNYIVQITRNTCTNPVSPPPVFINGPAYPDATASTVADVVDCVNKNSGSVTANALVNGVVQPAAGYSFNWYVYDAVAQPPVGTPPQPPVPNAAPTGSPLPAPNNVSIQTPGGLGAGWYQVSITDLSTQCKATTFPITQVKTTTVLPTATITQVAAQTSCDPTKPNGSLSAVGVATGYTSPTDFKFEWFREDNTLPANLIPITGGPETVSGTKGEILNNASAATYTVRVTTPLNCPATNKWTIPALLTKPVLSLDSIPNSICDATKTSPPIAYNGAVIAAVKFGATAVTIPDANYTFNWYDGTTTTTAHSPATSGGPSITSLKDGNYTVTVTKTDVHCVSDPVTIIVTKNTLVPILQATSTGSNNCDPALTPDGTVTVNVTNAPVAPAPLHNYTYQWYEVNPTTQAIISTLGAANTGTSKTATNVGGPYKPNKQYKVDVVDISNGCTSNTTQSVSDVSVIPVLTTTTKPNSICSPATNFNGSFIVSLQNPVGTYVYPTDFSFTWYNAKTNDPTKLIGTTNPGTANTTSDLTAKTISLVKLDTGSYAVIGKNTKTGCISTVYTDKVISAKIYPAILPASVGSNNCDPALTPDGKASYTITNLAQDAGPFTQQWYVGQGDPRLGAMAALPSSPNQGDQVTAIKVGGPNKPLGSAPHYYTVLVTNSVTGCNNYNAAAVPDNSSVPTVLTSTTGNAVCDPAKGMIGTMTATIETIPAGYTSADYRFRWFNGTDTTSFRTQQASPLTGLDSKSFTVAAKNMKTGCKSLPATDAVANDKHLPSLEPKPTGSNNCIADGTSSSGNGAVVRNDGIASVNPTGTLGGYLYQWFDGQVNLNTLIATPVYPVPGSYAGQRSSADAKSQTINFVGGPGGAHDYTVYVYDQGTGCSSYTYVTVPDNHALPKLATTTNPNDICSPASNFAGAVITTLDNTSPTNLQVRGAFPADYSFTWYNANTNDPTKVIGGTNPGTANTTSSPSTITLNKLDAGFYTVVGVNNLTGCISVPVWNQVDDDKKNPSLTMSSSGSHNCALTDAFGSPIKPDGIAKVEVATQGPGGADTFNFAWTPIASPTTVSPAPASQTDVQVPAVPSSTLAQVGGPNLVDPGTPFAYNVVVTNNRTKCFSPGQAQVQDDSRKPKLFVQPFDNTICDPLKATPVGNYNGHIDKTSIDNNYVVGYTGPAVTTYLYTWTDVTTLPATGHAVGTQTNVSNSSYAQLPEGKYKGAVTIRELGCVSDDVPVEVLKSTVTPVVTNTVINNNNCVPAKTANGSVSVTGITESLVAQSLTNYSYAWYDGNTASGAVLLTTIPGPTQVQAHTYTVQVTNNTTGCQGSTSSTIVDVHPTVDIAVKWDNDNTNCVGTPNGQLHAEVSLNNVVQSSPLTSSWAVTWSTTATTEVVSALAAGHYTASVVDTNTGCASTVNGNDVADSFTYPSFAFVETDQTSCDISAPNGDLKATASITAGSIASTIWYDGSNTSGTPSINQTNTATTAEISKLKANVDYTVVAIATGTGCSTPVTKSAGETITKPSLNFTGVSPVTICGPVPSGKTPNGAATATLTGISVTPATNFKVYYVRTVVVGPVGVGSYPTDPTTIKASTETYSGGANPPALVDLAPGYITALVVDNNTACESTPETAQIIDNTSQYAFQINSIATAGLCKVANPGGSIDITVLRNGVPCGPDCTFAWYDGKPANTNINFFNNPPDMSGSTLITTDEDLGVVNPAGGVSAGNYTVVVQDGSNGCGDFNVENIPTAAPATVSVIPTQPTLCVNATNIFNNGVIEVDVTKGLTSVDGYTVNIYQGNSAVAPSVLKQSVFTGTSSPFAPVIQNQLDNGDYFVEVIDMFGPNTPCPQGFQVTLTSKAFNPVITVDAINPNTSCDPSNVPDGKVQLTITKDALDTSTPKYYLTDIQNELPVGYAITANPAPGLAQGNLVGATGSPGQNTGLISGFKPQSVAVPSYTITITDYNSKCFKDVTLTIPDVTSVPDQLSVQIGAETMCAPSTNGTALAVIGASVPLSTDYQFTWSRVNDMTDLPNQVFIGTSNGGDATTGNGELLNGTHATSNVTTPPNNYWPGINPAVAAGQGVGTRTYYVQGKKNDPTKPGYGCKTAIVPAIIPDLHKSPDFAFTTSFDSFCQANAGNPVIGDGKITVTPDADQTTGGNQMPNNGAGFDYDWNPAPTNATNHTAPLTQNILTTPYIVGQLYDATYTVTVTNHDNKCNVAKTATINQAPFVYTIDATTVIDQRICNPDGRIKVTKVSLTDNSTSPATVTSTTDTDMPPAASDTRALEALYTFAWYSDATLTTILNGVSVSPITQQVLSNDSDEDPLTSQASDYTAMKTGTYYVLATGKDNTKPGFGCPTLPISVQVKDLHKNPLPNLDILSDTSCDPLAPAEGQITINVTDATVAPFNGGTYQYDWGVSPVLPGGSANPGAGNGDGIGADNDVYKFLVAGTYNLKITNIKTGCSIPLTPTVPKNSVPVFVQSVDTTPEVVCSPNGDGTLTVTKITVNERGGSTPISYDYTSTDPSHNISDFNFEWTRSMVSGYTHPTQGNVLANASLPALSIPDIYKNAGGFGIPIGADTYTVVATRKTGMPGHGCKSAPFTAEIKDDRKYPIATLTPFSNTSCLLSAPEGEIKINVADNTTAVSIATGFTYTWTAVPVGQASPPAAAPVGANNGDGFGTGDPSGGIVGNPPDNDEDHPKGLLNGTYAMTVKSNKSGCVSTATIDVPKNATPVFVQNVSVIDQILCSPDGSLQVTKVTLTDRTGASQTFDAALPNGAVENMYTDFQFEWTRVGDANNYTEITNVPTLIPQGAILDKSTYIVSPPAGAGFAATSPFGVGTYAVVARRKSGAPGAQCASAPYTVMLQDKALKPVVSLKPFANTACSGTFEGEIEVRVTDGTANNPLHTFTTPFKYDYTNWTTTSTTAPPATSPLTLLGANNGNVDDGGAPGTGGNPDGDGDNPKNLQDGDYTVTVLNPQTGCSSTGSTTIYKNSTPVFTQLVSPTDMFACKPGGHLVVNSVKVVDRNGNSQVSSTNFPTTGDFPLSDFAFIYDRGTVGTNVLGSTALPSGNTRLDSLSYVGNVANPTIGFDTYFVTATRVNGSPGFGCSAAPYQVFILDKRLYPSPSLTPLANTSCDPGFFEGEIKVSVTDANKTTKPLSGAFAYNYNWTVVPTLSQPLLWPAPGGSTTIFAGNNGDGYGNGDPSGGVTGNPPDNDNDHPKALVDGDYTVIVTNSTTGCSSPGQTTIYKNSTPVFTQLVTAIPQVFCKPSGHLTVKEVRIIDRNGVSQSNLNNDFPLSDFSFTYDRTTVGNTVFVDINDNTPHLDSLNYPVASGVIGFDNYYVTAKRMNGFPGKDCPSAPYLVAIDDRRVYPTVKFESVANSTCSRTKANGSLVAIASEPNGATVGPYTFAWTLNGGAIASATPAPVELPVPGHLNKDSLASAIDGAYIVTVTNTATGCPFDGSYNLLLDETRSTPSIIDVLITNPKDCNPTADAEVTKITLGSTYNSSLQPPLIPPDNTVTGPALGPPRFTYTWYEGSITNPPMSVTTPCIGPDCATPTTGLVTGDHFVTVKDTQTDCQSGPKQFAILPNDIIYPEVGITQTVKQISCIATTGVAELVASAREEDGTTANYTFAWYPSLDLTGTQFGPPNAKSTTFNPDTLRQLVVGNYSVQVKNTVTSCTASATFIVLDESPLFLPSISTGAYAQTFCVGTDGDASVRVILDPNYPLKPYDSTAFNVDMFKVTSAGDSLVAASMFTSKSNTAPGVIAYDSAFDATHPRRTMYAGTYKFKVTDKNTGCVTTDNTVIKLQQVKPIVAVVQDHPMTNCLIELNGQLSATADGGRIQGYKFDWYSGSTVVAGKIIPPSDNKLIGQASGPYIVRVTNSLTGCYDDKTGNIEDMTVTPPTPTALTLHDLTSCVTPNGEVTANVGGVILGYTFQWYDGQYTDKSKLPPTYDYKYADYVGLNVGYYSVTATDDVTHCVSQPANTPVVDKRVKPAFHIDSTPSYCIDTGRPRGNGSFNLSPDVSEPFLTIIWSLQGDTTNLVGQGPYVAELFPGDYHVLVTTVDGCQHSENAKIATEIKPYNLVSTNNDGQNDAFIVDCISEFTIARGALHDNNVKIFNRNGTLVYEANGYDNQTIFFRGVGEKGVYFGDKELPEGTYFYIIDKRNGTKPKTGFLELVR